MAEHFEYFHSSLNDVNAICALFAGFIIIFGFISLVVKERLYLSDTLGAMVFGIIIGPRALNLIDPSRWEGDDFRTSYVFSEVIIAIQLMAAGISLPSRFWRIRAKSLLILLIPIMLWMWLMTSILIYGIMDVPWLTALVIGSCVAPTDPILANAIVSGRFAEKYISLPIRNLLSGESAVNDGIAVPFFSLAMLLKNSSDNGADFGIWFYRVWVYEVIAGCLLSAAIGWIVKVCLKTSETRGWIDKKSFLTVEITLAIFMLGILNLLSMASFLGTLTCSVVFSWDGWFAKEAGEAHAQEVIDNILNLSFFIYFGASIPWSSFNTPDIPIWRLFVLVISIMLIRRLPITMALYKFMPILPTYRDALLVGWFGPIGVSAFWYMTEAHRELQENEYVVPVLYFIVFISVIVYGITAPFIHFTLRTITTFTTKSHELRAPQWPSNVPMSTNAISGPRIVEPELYVPNDPDYNHTASILVKRPSQQALPIPEFDAMNDGGENGYYIHEDDESNGSSSSHQVRIYVGDDNEGYKKDGQIHVVTGGNIITNDPNKYTTDRNQSPEDDTQHTGVTSVAPGSSSPRVIQPRPGSPTLDTDYQGGGDLYRADIADDASVRNMETQRSSGNEIGSNIESIRESESNGSVSSNAFKRSDTNATTSTNTNSLWSPQSPNGEFLSVPGVPMFKSQSIDGRTSERSTSLTEQNTHVRSETDNSGSRDKVGGYIIKKYPSSTSASRASSVNASGSRARLSKPGMSVSQERPSSTSRSVQFHESIIDKDKKR